jgi:hypothetical protein
MLDVVRGKRQRGAQVVLGEGRVRFEHVGKRAARAEVRGMCSTVMRVPLMQGLPIITADRSRCGRAA